MSIGSMRNWGEFRVYPQIKKVTDLLDFDEKLYIHIIKIGKVHFGPFPSKMIFRGFLYNL